MRCGATFVENDFRVTNAGDLITITDENLLYQICLKALTTRRGSNRFYTFFGTRLLDTIGRKDVMGMQAYLTREVSSAFALVQKAQNAQAKYQQTSQRERFAGLLGVTVIPHEDDPTAFLIDVTVQSATAMPISLSIVYTAPSAVALAGTNGRSLGVR